MSSVHDRIAREAMSVQSPEVRRLFSPFKNDLKESSWYPDYFADRSMSKEEKAKIDPEANRFIYPDPPKTDLQKKLKQLAGDNIYSDAPPLKQVYLIGYYLKNAVDSLKAGDTKSAIKFCGVYSHVIADICEPIHAMNPAILDIVVPPPPKFVGMELHANVEGLKAPVRVKGYQPKLLGINLAQAEMGAYAGLIKAHKFGAAQATPIVQALYAGKKQQAKDLSSLAQSESAKHFADFIYTVYILANNQVSKKEFPLDLREYPRTGGYVDMLYRYAPTVDVALVPYSKGKLIPLALKDSHGKTQKVKGLGVIPFLGPPFTKDLLRETWLEYYLVPKAYKKFTARVGLHPQFENSISSVEFSVFGDGRELVRSKVIKPSDPGVEIVANLGKTQWLELAMRYVKNPTRSDLKSAKTHLDWVSHGVWADPKLS